MRRPEELLSELKPVRRISRRPCVTVQPPHLWCCFASPQKETVVGHVALGRQLGGGRRGGGGQGACGTATGECSEETGREGFLSSSAGRQHSDDGSSALPGKRGTGWLWMRRKNTQVVHTVGGQPWSHIGGRLGPSLGCRGHTFRGRDAPAALLLLSSAPLTQCSRSQRPAPPRLGHLLAPGSHTCGQVDPRRWKHENTGT